MKACMLTTMDNPYNPFTDFDEWLYFDIAHSYKTCELLAYFAKTSKDLDENDYNEELNNAVDEFLAINPFGVHMKVYEDEASSLIKLANKAFRENKVKETA